MISRKIIRFKIKKKTFKDNRKLSSSCDLCCKETTLSIKDLPGPGPVLPYLGSTWIYSWLGPYSKRNRSTDAREDLIRKYGPIYCEYFGKTPLVNVSDPRDIMKVMKSQGKTPIRSSNESYVYMRKQNPDVYKSVGLTESNGEEWRNLRSKVAPILLQRPMPECYDLCSPIAEELVQRLKANGEYVDDVSKFLTLPITQMSWLMFFGERLGASGDVTNEHAEMISSMSKHIIYGLGILSTSSLWKYFPTRAFRRMQTAENYIRRIIKEKVEDKIRNLKSNRGTTTYEPICEQLLKIKDFDVGDIITLQTDLVVPSTLSIGSIFLTLLLHRLGKEPRVMKELQREIDEILPDPTSKITARTFRSAPYLKAVFREGYRLTTIIPCLARVLPNDINLRGYSIPAFTPILCQTRASARQEKYFSYPLEFIPERWLSKHQLSDATEEDIRLIKEAEMARPLVSPYGVGPRMCAGKVCVELQMKVLLTKLVKTFTLESEGEIEIGDYFILAPINPVAIRFIDRAKSSTK